MHGRRSHARFSTSNAEGVLTVLREVAVSQTPTGEFLAVDREPRRVGEIVTLEMRVNLKSTSTRMRVVATCPIVKNDSVCHQLTLKPVGADDDEEIR